MRALLLLLLLSSCSLNQTDEAKKDRSMALLNQRKYAQSVDELEASLRANPNDRSTALLLAMAHIGHADAEMLQLFSAVLGKQEHPAPALLAKVKCNDEPWDSLKDESIACVASRILRQVPDELNGDVARSQQLLRQYYGNPKVTSADVNFFAAYVETYRLLNRFNALASPATGARFDELHLDNTKFDDISSPEFEKADSLFGYLVRELKTMGDEFMQVYKRLKYSYSKLAKYTASIDGKPLVSYKGHVLIFDEDMSVSRIARFAITVLEDEEGKADDRLNANVSGILARSMPQLVRVAQRLRYVSGPTMAWNRISTAFRFERLFKDFLKGLSGGLGRGPSADLSGWMVTEVEKAGNEMWEHPPGIFGDFLNAMKDSWDSESLRALSAYHKASAPEWEELSAICRLWGEVRDNKADRFEGRRMVKDLVARREANRDYLKFPDTVDARSVNTWLRDVLTEGSIYERNYELGKYSSNLKPPSHARVALVHEAWARSVTWLDHNVLAR
jgi:hypothetical protein